MYLCEDLSDNDTSDSDLPDPVFNVSLPPPKKRQMRLLSSKNDRNFTGDDNVDLPPGPVTHEVIDLTGEDPVCTSVECLMPSTMLQSGLSHFRSSGPSRSSGLSQLNRSGSESL